MRWYFRISLLTSFFVLLWFLGVHGSQPMMPTIDVEMSLTFSSEPELGEEFTVTLTFTPREDIPHKNELNDETKIAFGDGIELVSGQPYWEGRLQKNQTETIEIVLRPIKPGRFLISGLLRYCQVDPWFILPDRELERETGMEFFGKVFEYHDGTGKQFWIGEPHDSIEIWSIDLKTGESKTIEVESRSLAERDRSVAVHERTIHGLEKKNSTKDSLVVPKEKEYGFPIEKANETPDSVRAFFVGDISLRKGESVTVFLFDQEKVVQAVWHCEPESSCKIETLPDHKVRITSSWEEGDYLIVGAFAGVQHIIRVTVTGSH